MGTFKDISSFGNFVFPLEGEYAGGVIAHSLAGTGKVSKKTKEQQGVLLWLGQQVHQCPLNYHKAVMSSFIEPLAKVMCAACGS